MTFARVMALGDGAFLWSAPVVRATFRTESGQLRTIHEDGAMIVWSPEGAPRVCARTRPTTHAAWVDERLAILEHDSPSELELRALDEPAPRWTVRCSGNHPLVVLPCKSMFFRDGRGHWTSTLYSLADGSALEESDIRDRWLSVGRHATCRSVLRRESGPVLRSWYDTERSLVEELGPPTYTWRLERDGKTLLEAVCGSSGYPSRAWIAEDDSRITLVVGDRWQVLSLPDLQPLSRPSPEPKPVEPPSPARRYSFEDVPEVPSRAGLKARWGQEVSIYEHFLERDGLLRVSTGRDIRYFRRGESKPFAAHHLPWRGTHVLAALGGDLALVADTALDLPYPGAVRPATVQLRVFALPPGATQPRLLRILSEQPWRELGAQRRLLAVSSDGGLGLEAITSEPAVRLWDLASGSLLQTLDLGPDQDGVQGLAFGGGHRFFLETTRGRVFGYAPA